MGSLDKTGADEYFLTHVARALWEEANDAEKEAAVRYAKAILERTKSGDLDEPAATADNTDVREDYALYEQALHVLTHNPYRANAEQTGITWDLSNNGDTGSEMRDLCAEAIYWMGWNNVKVVRA